MVNFTCQCNWAKGCPEIILACLWGCFWMRLTFELVDWVQQIRHPIVCRSYPISWRPNLLNWAKRLRGNFVFMMVCASSFGFLLLDWNLHHQSSFFSGLCNQTETIPGVFPGLQLADCWSQDFSASIIMEAKSLFIYVCVCVCVCVCVWWVMFLWRTLTDRETISVVCLPIQCCFWKSMLFFTKLYVFLRNRKKIP